MRNFRALLRKKKIILTCALFVLVSATAIKIRQQYLYPTSTETIDPVTGLYNPSLEHQLLDNVTYTPTSVEIDMGDRSGSGGTDVDNLQCLYLLSPVLQLNPNAKRFIVKWEYVTSIYWQTQLTYDRGIGTVSEQGGHGHNLSAPVVVATGVSDRTIHRAAQKGDSYLSLNK